MARKKVLIEPEVVEEVTVPVEEKVEEKKEPQGHYVDSLGPNGRVMVFVED